MDLYTVDRLGLLQEGKTYNLQRYNDINPDFLSSHVDDMYPNGVSAHGERYLLRNESSTMEASPLLELVFEYVRKSGFPNLPSRFECMFAFDSIENAKEFRIRFGSESKPIFKVQSESFFRANMSLLYGGNSILVTSYFANQYWSGEVGPNDVFWEYLLPLPVKIIERVI